MRTRSEHTSNTLADASATVVTTRGHASWGDGYDAVALLDGPGAVDDGLDLVLIEHVDGRQEWVACGRLSPRVNDGPEADGSTVPITDDESPF